MENPNICLALTGETLKKNEETARKYSGYVDIFELRADFLNHSELPLIAEFTGMVDKKVILTVRRERDGGKYRESEASRVNLIKAALSGKFDFVDVEEDLRDREYEKLITSSGAVVIRSFHDFDNVPENLVSRMRKMAVSGKEIVKAAVMPKSTADLLSVFKAAGELKDLKKILIGMGDYGFSTRVLASRLGSFLTYTSALNEHQAAPGHIDPETMEEVYRFSAIDESTRLFGIIGNPIGHTLSPKIHNPAYRKLNMNAVYVPFKVDDVKAFFELADLLQVQGFSVTIPHKGNVIPFLRKKDPATEKTGACNTVVRTAEGWQGHNTDVDGFLYPLVRHYKGSFPRGIKVTVIGAGGAARAVVHALAESGCSVLILNRTASKAEKLAENFGCKWASLDSEGLKMMEDFSELIVQTTNAGMEPDTTLDPLEGYSFKGNEIVYEIIYKPLITRFLSRAREKGCTVITGDKMLLAQAWRQFKLFTGHEYPENI
ncbi:MAG: shikimate dehydrogenase [Spirochaetales bacterium]|nr:shikimate dehydrogenase [Spirochaetales bacterium]